MSPNVLRAPPGYSGLLPLNREQHRGLGIAPHDDDWCRALNAVPLSGSEFGSAATAFPIAFSRDVETGEFQPVAVLGLRAQENLFVESRRWRPHTYQPAFVRRYPFCIAEIPDPLGIAPQRLVCIEPSQLVPVAPEAALFGVDGTASPQWENIQRLLEAMEAARLQTRLLCKRLDTLGLFTPFEALAVPREGKRMRLQGMHRVDEEKLQDIPGKDLRNMLRRGELKAVYAHLVSLENFATLMELAAVRDAQ